MTPKPGGAPSSREAGLRQLAAGGRDRVETNIQYALQELHQPAIPTKKSVELHALVEGVSSSMPHGTRTDQRAKALWRLIEDEVRHVELRDERNALIAALHLDPDNREPTIDRRLALARDRGDFGTQASGKRHGYDALRHWWGEGVRLLGHAVDERLDYLHDHSNEWSEYFTDAAEPRFRKPSSGAQPVFADLFVTTVFMRGRYVHRRITERVVTAQEDGVEFYTARALPEMDDAAVSVPVRALWGCRAEPVPSPPGEPVLTRLYFPAPLRRGERHYFSSEAMAGEVASGERRAINVEVDHHGIAPGRRLFGAFPTSGLTIRIRFDEQQIPAEAWWYADAGERARYTPPADGDPRWLKVTALGHVEHTFAEACQPQANYGVSIRWPSS